MKARYELKYALSPELVSEVLKKIRRHAVLDPFAEKRKKHQYTVKSIYFDSATLKYYFEKLDGLKVRKKLRIRTYDREKENVFIEIKRRYINLIVKERVPFPQREMILLFGEMQELDNSQSSPSTGYVVNKFFYNMLKEKLRPTVLVVYERKPFVHPLDSNQRITIDFDLRAYAYPRLEDLLDGVEGLSISHPFAILELKFNDFMPKWMRELVQEYNLFPQSISKYCLGIEKACLVAR